MPTIKSSHIRSVSHNAAIGMMKVHFWNGSEYEYYSITKREYVDVINAPNVGKKLNLSIKTSKPFFQTKYKTIGTEV